MIDISRLSNSIQDLSNIIQKEIVSEALSFLPDTSFVTDKKAEQRLELCETCENLIDSNRKCSICGCFVDLKTKVKKLPFMEPEECPLKYW